MNYANYSTLKGKSKQAFKKIAAVAEVKNDAGNVTTHAVPEYVVIETKRYDSNTGEEKTASTNKVNLAELESNKAQLTSQKAKIDAELVELEAMITDIKAL